MTTPFIIHASTNPHTEGRGTCFTVSVPPPHERALVPLSVMFDTYDTKPTVSAVLMGFCSLDDAADTDEGCYLHFKGPHAQLTVALPMSIAALRNSLDPLTDERADDTPPHGITRPTLVPDE